MRALGERALCVRGMCVGMGQEDGWRGEIASIMRERERGIGSGFSKILRSRVCLGRLQIVRATPCQELDTHAEISAQINSSTHHQGQPPNLQLGFAKCQSLCQGQRLKNGYGKVSRTRHTCRNLCQPPNLQLACSKTMDPLLGVSFRFFQMPKSLPRPTPEKWLWQRVKNSTHMPKSLPTPKSATGLQ